MTYRGSVVVIGFALLTAPLIGTFAAQQTYSGPIRYGTSAGVCSYLGELWVNTSVSPPTLHICSVITPATWTAIGGGGGEAIPAGAMLLIDSGTCPPGYSEVSAADGRMLRGTVAANGDVGTTGGSDTLVPAGTIAPPTLTMNSYTPAGTVAAPVFTGSALATHTHTFTGSALATHAHELPFQIPTTTTTRQIAVATFGTGTARAATAVSAAGTANTTSAAVALSQAVSAGTPAGTNAAISAGTPAGTNSAPAFTGTPATLTGTITAPTFTGSSADNRAAFTRVIGCKKT